MNREQYDEAAETVTLADSESVTLDISTLHCTDVITQIGDGSGGPPPGYELEQRVYSKEADEYLQYDSVGSDADPETTPSWTDSALLTRWKTVLYNRSGGEATFRIRTVSVGEGP